MFKLIFSLIFFVSLFQVRAQEFNNLVEAFKAGDSKLVTELMDAKIEWSAFGKEQMMSKVDAVQELKQFFEDIEIKTFKIVHKGVSQNDVHYMIGELVTYDSNYRLTIYLKKSGENYLIQSLEIEP